MKTRISIIVVVLIALATSAGAQSNLALTGGMLIPFGDFGDVADPSPYVAARFEIQDVNVLGQVAVMSFLVQAGFAFLQTDSDLEEALDEAGISDDGSYFDLTVGSRVYSTASPLFVGAGVGFANVDFAGTDDSSNGFDIFAGIGLVLDTASVKFDIEGRGSIVLIEDDSINHFQILASLGFPFE